ncbi:hypothetical protein K474DRAFT_895382 [Panus rudis PR-1116 ss-1]|nr:hypothetical protein K474DRAFT_895382 [Panus rudis PR-1116 ss-1]
MRLSQIYPSLCHHAVTAYLFTKSDITIVAIPLSISSLSLVPLINPLRVPQGIFWIWVHIIQFTLSNQILSVEEDKANKSWRPLPAGRISSQSARRCWWSLAPTCFLYSLCYGIEVAYASLLLLVFTVVYNDFEAHNHWLLRNLVSAVGLASFETGAASIMCGGWMYLDTISILAICTNIAIHITTLHATDFKDVDGDRMIGRRTLPIIAPTLARYTMICGLTTWCAVLGYLWNTGILLWALLLFSGLYTGYRFVAMREVVDDRVSGNWYNLWLSISHLLPLYYRYRKY